MNNTPFTFVTFMNKVFALHNGKHALVYLDNIIVYSPSLKQHHEDLEAVFKALQTHCLLNKPSKCLFYQTSLPFLGHIITKDGIRLDPEKVSAIQKMPPPKGKSELCTFLSMVSYICRFIQNGSTLMAPLLAITQPKANFVWTPHHNWCFCQLKDKLMTALILQYPKRDREYEMETDASYTSIWGVLRIQNQEGAFLPVAYKSQKLTDSKQCYPIHDKKLLAIIHCLTCWNCYLEQQIKFTILTDHKMLIYFKMQTNLSRQQEKWMEILERFNSKIQYKPGKELVTADALSQLYICNTQGEKSLDPNWPLLIMCNKDEGFLAGTTDVTYNTIVKNEHLFIDLYGTLHQKLPDGTTVPYIPTHQRIDTTLHYHQDLGHTRTQNLYELLKLKCWWPNMLRDIENVLSQCKVCKKYAKNLNQQSQSWRFIHTNPLKYGP